MKYKLNGNWVDLSVKALDSMPVGSIVEYDGQASDIPSGWEEDTSNVLYENASGAGVSDNITLSDDVDNYTYFLFLGVDKDNPTVTSMEFIMYKHLGNKLEGSSFVVSSSTYSLTTRTYTYSGKNLTYSSQYYYASNQGVFPYANFKLQKVIGYK